MQPPIQYLVAFLVIFCTLGQEDDWGQHMQSHQEPLSASGGGIIPVLTGLVGFGLGSVFPIGRGRTKGGGNVDKLQQSISTKNVEIQKLKTMIYEYEFQVAELKKGLFQCEQDSLKRDYEEFKQPDVNGDDVISRMEFGTYIRNYMKAYPHIPVEDYPTFDDFDINRDGLVTFQEWQEYLYQQQLLEKEQEELQALTGKSSHNAATEMYDLSSNTANFQTLYEQLQQQQARQGYRS